MTRKNFLYMFWVFLITSCAANVFFRPATHDYLINPEIDTLFPIYGCKVLYLDKVAIQRDFPQLRHLTTDELKNWIQDSYCIMSKWQERLENFRCSTIPWKSQTTPIVGYRQPTVILRIMIVGKSSDSVCT